MTARYRGPRDGVDVRADPTRRRAPGLVVFLAAVVVVLAACSGVPTNSVPQVVRTVDSGGDLTTSPVATPAADAEPRDIVSGFLAANVSNDEAHPAARQFLAPAVRAKWSATTATIVDDYFIGFQDSRTNIIKVTAQVLGTLDDRGIYTPAPPGASSVAPRVIPFKMVETSAGWRISDPPVGLTIRRQDFGTAYLLRPLYFFNLAETKLVPDLRYSADEGQSLATWALAQLLAGPQAGQQNERRNEFPDQVDPLRAKVVSGDPVMVQLPGISQVDTKTVARVAAQLAYTFKAFAPNATLTLFDGLNSVPIPNVPTQFTAGDFPLADPEIGESSQSVYFLRSGALYDSTGHVVNGPFGSGRYGFTSIAVDNAHDGTPIRAAGIGAAPAKLVVGDLPGPARTVQLKEPATSRPEWTHDNPREVWIGTGTHLERVGDGGAANVTFTASQSVALTGQSVVSLRFSPEGARIAMVLRLPGGTSSLWLGQVVRAASSVQVEDLRQITPSTWHVVDVAWADATRLRVIDTGTDGSTFQIWSLRADGSDPRSSVGADSLPGVPQWITAGPAGVAWVSVRDTLWVESFDGEWSPPFGTRQQLGRAPVYAS